MIHAAAFPASQEAIFISNYISQKSNSKGQQRLILAICCTAIGIILVVLILLLLLPSKTSEPECPVQENQTPSESTIPVTLPDPKIASGVSVYGIPVGGMTAEEAADAIRLAVSDVYEK